MTDVESDQSSKSAPSAAWDAAAGWWKERTDGNDPYRQFVHGPALFDTCGDVNGATVLDVGCGSGYFSRVLARAGADVRAFDCSESLVALAVREEEKSPLGIKYEQLDAARISSRFDPQKFDLVTGCMSIADIEELDAALTGIRDVLKPNGKFCFSFPHPFASPPENRWSSDAANGVEGRFVSRYFGRRRVASGLNRISGKPEGPEIRIWHMPISDWMELLTESGFLANRLIEPRPTVEQVEAHPALSRLSDVPEFMVISATRISRLS